MDDKLCMICDLHSFEGDVCKLCEYDCSKEIVDESSVVDSVSNIAESATEVIAESDSDIGVDSNSENAIEDNTTVSNEDGDEVCEPSNENP